jgi:hypothetical protein
MIDRINRIKFSSGLPEKTVNKLAVCLIDQFAEVIDQNKLSSEKLQLYHKILSSNYLQASYIERSCDYYVKPVIKKVTNEQGQSVDVSVVSLTSLCRKYLTNISLCKRLIREKETSNRGQHQSLEYDSILSGSSSARLRGKLKLELFIDDTNLSSSTYTGTRQKFLKVYASFADLPIQNRAHSDDIEMVLLVNRSKLKQRNISLDMILKDVRDELLMLSVDGIQVQVEGKDVKFQVTLSAVCGDNLGINELLGFKCCFTNAAFVCRYCGALGRDRSGEDAPSIQNLGWQHDLITGLASNELAKYGIIRPFIFDGLPDIDRWSIAPPDNAHDLCEGVLPDITELILQSLVENNQEFLAATGDSSGSKQELSQRQREVRARTFILEKFAAFKHNFYEGAIEIKWEVGKGFKLRGTAIQVCIWHVLNFAFNRTNFLIITETGGFY